MVRDLPNSADKTDEIALTIYLSGVSSHSSRKRPGNGGFIQMVRNFPPLRSEWKKRSTSEDIPHFPNGISGKLRFHLPNVQSNLEPKLLAVCWLQTEISGIFGQMVSTPELSITTKTEYWIVETP